MNKLLPQIIVILQNVLKWVNPFYPNSMFCFFLQVIFLDDLTLGIFGLFLAPFQIDGANFGHIIMFLKIILVRS